MRTKIAHVALYGVTAIVPGLAMAAAHWFPWRAVLGRDLNRLESYAWGCAWIVGIAAAAMRLSSRIDAPLSPDQSARAVEIAAVSAGAATVAAHLVDDWTAHRRANVAARIAAEAKRNHAQGE